MHLSQNNLKPLMSAKVTRQSGIKVIDDYYESINDIDQIDHIRNSTEITRLVQQIKHIWRANKFPKCETNFFVHKMQKYFKDPHFEQIQDEISD